MALKPNPYGRVPKVEDCFWPAGVEPKIILSIDPQRVSSSLREFAVRRLIVNPRHLQADEFEATHVLLDSLLTVSEQELSAYEAKGQRVLSFDWAIDSFLEGRAQEEDRYRIVAGGPVKDEQAEEGEDGRAEGYPPAPAPAAAGDLVADPQAPVKEEEEEHVEQDVEMADEGDERPSRTGQDRAPSQDSANPSPSDSFGDDQSDLSEDSSYQTDEEAASTDEEEERDDCDGDFKQEDISDSEAGPGPSRGRAPSPSLGPEYREASARSRKKGKGRALLSDGSHGNNSSSEEAGEEDSSDESFNENNSPRNKKVGKSSVKKKAPAKGPSGRKRPDRTPPDTPVVLVPHNEIVSAPREFSAQGRDALEAVNHLIRTGQTDQPQWELPTGDRLHYYGEDPAAIALSLPGTIGTAIFNLPEARTFLAAMAPKARNKYRSDRHPTKPGAGWDKFEDLFLLWMRARRDPTVSDNAREEQKWLFLRIFQVGLTHRHTSAISARWRTKKDPLRRTFFDAAVAYLRARPDLVLPPLPNPWYPPGSRSLSPQENADLAKVFVSLASDQKAGFQAFMNKAYWVTDQKRCYNDISDVWKPIWKLRYPEKSEYGRRSLKKQESAQAVAEPVASGSSSRLSRRARSASSSSRGSVGEGPSSKRPKLESDS